MTDKELVDEFQRIINRLDELESPAAASFEVENRLANIESRLSDCENNIKFLQRDSHNNHYELEGQITRLRSEIDNLKTNIRYGTNF